MATYLPDSFNNAPEDAERSRHYTRVLSDRLIWQSRYRLYRIARYACWRTRFRGPDPSEFGAIAASGKIELCNSCKFFADAPQVVCGIHPSGPSQSVCPDWEAKSPACPKEY